MRPPIHGLFAAFYVRDSELLWMVPWCALACCCSSAVCLIFPPNLTLPQAQFVKFKEGRASGARASALASEVCGVDNMQMMRLQHAAGASISTDSDGSKFEKLPLVSDAHCLVRFQRFCLFQANLPALSFRSLISMTLLTTHAVGVSLK